MSEETAQAIKMMNSNLLEMIGTCFSGLAALDSNSVCASPGQQPWGARNGHENGPPRFPLFLQRDNIR